MAAYCGTCMDITSQETTPIRKSAFWEQKGSGNGQISRANFEEKKGRKNLKKKNILSLAPHNEHIEPKK